ncbi:MAG: hypothetical protein WB698_14955 [Solirubrobacteraceae bacterium]
MTELHRPALLDPRRHDREQFDSGEPVLDEWLRRYAGQNRRRDTSATWVITDANDVVIAGPIWLGDQSSLTRKIIERLYAYSSEVNEAGQWAYYGKVGAAITTGNDDGGKHVSAQVLYALQHIGLTIPPQSDTYWTGEAGPGPSYLDAVGGGEQNAWATRNTVFLAWNVLHLARMLADAGGIPAYGNSTHDWDLGHPDHPNPEHRR